MGHLGFELFEGDLSIRERDDDFGVVVGLLTRAYLEDDML